MKPGFVRTVSLSSFHFRRRKISDVKIGETKTLVASEKRAATIIFGVGETKNRLVSIGNVAGERSTTNIPNLEQMMLSISRKEDFSEGFLRALKNVFHAKGKMEFFSGSGRNIFGLSLNTPKY